jgi:oligopeptide/dipeptide ABC transporter ATP-binding protein
MSALSVRDLHIALNTAAGSQPVVRGISFDLEPGELTGLAGESGCGKSLTALALMGLLPPGLATVRAQRAQLGKLQLFGQSASQWRGLRGRAVAMVFQDPATALDPVFTIGQQLSTVLRRRGGGRQAVRASALQALHDSGFAEPEDIFAAYPHQLSGGMRQLAMIAMAGAARPSVLLADEPTTALDVTTQALVLRQLHALAERHGTAVLLISHDLRVLAAHARRLLVMYCGRLVETANAGSFFEQAHHPYSAGLLAAMPGLGASPQRAKCIPGQVPAPGELLEACAFAPRCQRASALCRDSTPQLAPLGSGRVACHHPL